jgi:homoserine O-succinyltransferase/O-acetyltransferase
MPVLIDRAPSGRGIRAPERFLELALVNNMPDAALESTERQFLELLRAAAGDIPVRLRLFALPDVPRSDAGRAHLSAGYAGLDELRDSRLDGLIVTGTEPRAPELSGEPYWGSFVDLLQWAQANTASTIWSCLAAHAAVLHMDGIRRQPLDDKRFGIFECTKVSDHALLSGVPVRARIAHSRWNELPEQALRSCGYDILTLSPEAGVDAFVKQRQSLFVFFQGHPEYDERALLREYRRDVGRFLRSERETYPGLPRGYFDVVASDVLASFRNQALADRREGLLEAFPTSFLEARLNFTGGTAVSRLYHNWLLYLCADKAKRQAPSRERPRSHRTGASQPAAERVG